MSRRQKVLGLPIGRRKPSFPLARAARMGAVGVAALAAVPAAQRGARVMQKGQDLADGAGHALDAVKAMKDGVSSHSSTVGKAAGVIGAVRKLKNGDGDKPKLSHLIEEHTDISVSRRVAYDQWTQMEMFPRITKGIISVEQENDTEAEWTSKIGPLTRQWKGKITEQVPDERIAWKSEGGPDHEGVVTFHSLDDDLTRVLVQMHYKPQGPFEVVANKLRIQRRRVRRDLRLFKHFLELRGEATGAWRGTVNGDDSTDQSEAGRNGSASRNRRSATARKSRNGSQTSKSNGNRASSGSTGARRTRTNGAGSSRGSSGSNGVSRRRSSSSNGRSSGARKSTSGRARAGSRS